MVGGLHFKVIKPRPRNPRGLHFGAIRLFFLRWKVRIFPGSSVYIRQAIARQSPSSSRGAMVGWSEPRRGGVRKGGRRSPRHAQRGCIERRACAPRRATDLLQGRDQGGTWSGRGGGAPPESGYSKRAMRLMTPPASRRVISPFRHALKSVMFLNAFAGVGPLSLFARGCSSLLLCLRRGFWRRRGLFRLFFFLGG